MDLTKFFQKHGEPQNPMKLELSELQRETFPKEFVSIYDQYGLSSFSKGFLWLMNPEKYHEYVLSWLNNTEKAVPFLRTAFGSFFILMETI